ncbi:hypothetical protein Taro_056096 [Colocasia esculenta]|uniref:Uncharacterized protein n=1 Tax=Colocasia esculenta TaxID=4460 RepID=A0A843XW93_COLES|nr:hypothetical protein [Colocasia esculenta]
MRITGGAHTQSRPVTAIGRRAQLDVRSPPQPTISPIPRFFGSSDSLDYANCWRSPQAESPSQSDRRSCLTQCEISFLGCGYGCPNIADIVTPSGLFPPLQ